ncbi:MAG TPA: zinc ribbon domain-containing protein [Candidatus Limnocylindrales bacterium]
MPAYDYLCDNCGHRFEVLHGVHAEGPTICPNCGSRRLRKAISAPAVHFKGSGWAKKERRTAAASVGSGSGGASSDGSDGGDGGDGDATLAGTKPSTDGEKGPREEKGATGEKASKGEKGSDGDRAPARSASSDASGSAASRVGSSKAAASDGDT